MRVKYLDILKAFAILAVVLYHAGLMPFGYLGVDLFLVIAGYLTTRTLYRAAMDKSKGGYVSFEINRLVRLLPPLLLVEALCLVLGYFLMLPDDYENLSQSVVATNLFSNNILAAITTKNYWDVVNDYKPLMHTWYVGVLMQFYLVYPLLFYLSRLNKKNPKGTLLTIISTLAVASLLVYFATGDAAQRFYYLPSRFFEFAVGGIVAIVYDPKTDNPFGRLYVYICYALLILLMTLDIEFVPSVVRLVAVVFLSVVLLSSQFVLENKVTGNVFFAKIGAASYSIFVWHQVLLAFCRYTWTSDFTLKTYSVLLVVTALLSWLSYLFIEQGTIKALKTKRGKTSIYVMSIFGFVFLTCFAVYIYRQGGVVRDVPELYITKGEKVNHKAYNDKIYNLDKPFETEKRHWLVIGNSFGRDFANVILESNVADSVEVSYIPLDRYMQPKYGERIATSDKVFLSSLGTDEALISQMRTTCLSNGLPNSSLVIVGTKNFGTSNGQFYFNRGKVGYFEQRTTMEKGYKETNERLKQYCGNSYLDLIGLVIDADGTVPVFTPDHHYISQDCRHFSMGGAKWFAILIDWSKYWD